jgi:undecaprenyl-diphosphatase
MVCKSHDGSHFETKRMPHPSPKPSGSSVGTKIDTIPAHMRDSAPDTVIPGGQHAPLGARAGTAEPPGEAPAEGAEPSPRELHRDRGGLPLAVAPRWLALILVLSLVAYAAVAADVVHEGRLTELDQDTSEWVARSMPAWSEWTARVLSVVGGFIGVTLLVVPAVLWLLWRGERAAGVLLAAVAIGAQVLTIASKNGYDRPRPTAGSPIDLPSSWSYPSGHSLTGIAVFGLLGSLLALRLSSIWGRAGAVAAGFILGALSGASRVVLNVHFLSDVLAGSALGLAWLVSCLLVAGLVERARHR